MKIIALAALTAVVALILALPALAATPVYTGVVGPGFTITMAKKPTKAGKIKLVIRDKSSVHNFHLTGPGVNVKTSVPAIGTKTFTITLKKGTYKFICVRTVHEGLVHDQVVRHRCGARHRPRPRNGSPAARRLAQPAEVSGTGRFLPRRCATRRARPWGPCR